MTIADWIQLGILAATGVAVAFSIRSVRDQLWLQTFSEYTNRYLAILDSLPEAARLPEMALDPSELSSDAQHHLFIALRRYFNLCSEEFYLHKRRRIDKETWRIWQAGIQATMRLPTFRKGWDIVGPEYHYFPDFQSFMQRVVDGQSLFPSSVPLTPAG